MNIQNASKFKRSENAKVETSTIGEKGITRCSSNKPNITAAEYRR
jgi:hypothetical protein